MSIIYKQTLLQSKISFVRALLRLISYFISKDMQSVHSDTVGFASCVPTLIFESAQYCASSQWFLQLVTLHSMLWLGVLHPQWLIISSP